MTDTSIKRGIKYRLTLIKDASFTYEAKICQPSDCHSILRALLGGADREHLVVIALNTKGKVIGVNIAFIGSRNTIHAPAAEILRFAILSATDTFLVAHNHPSGDNSPSKDDVNFTQNLKAGASIVGCTLVDHIIYDGDNGFYSLKAHGDM